jgi:hypothetical protein
MINKFTLIDILKTKYKKPLYTQTWIYTGITSYFSQQNKFDELIFTDEIMPVVFEDWANRIFRGCTRYGCVYEGHVGTWIDKSWNNQVTNCTIITGYEHVGQYNGNTTLGFDFWDVNVYNDFSHHCFYYELNHSSVADAQYDVVIPTGSYTRPHRLEFLTQFENQTENLTIVTDDRQPILTTDLRFKELGIEVYLNKFNIPNYKDHAFHPSFYDINKNQSIDHLPHKKMHSIARVNVILETTAYSVDQPYLTEKTYKVLAQHRPFVIFGDTCCLAKLKRQGFQTFDKFCDESYDTEPDMKIRAHKAIQAIKQLVKSCKQYPNEIDQICQHNQKLFFNQQRHTDNLARFGKLCLDKLF